MNAIQEILSIEKFLEHVKKVDEIWSRPPTSIIFPIEFEDTFSDVSLNPIHDSRRGLPNFSIYNPSDPYLYLSPFDKRPGGRLGEDVYKSAKRFLEISSTFSWGSIKLKGTAGADFPLKFLEGNWGGSFLMTNLKKYYTEANPWRHEKLKRTVDYLKSEGYKGAWKGRDMF